MSLITNDSAVLQTLFDGEPSSSAVKIDPGLSPFPEMQMTMEDYEAVTSRERSIIALQVDSDDTSETLQSTVQALDALISEHPSYPPAYANRAQAVRMLPGSQSPEASDRVFADLDRAITLSTRSSPAGPVSPAQARVLADAHTHRGYLLLQAARARNAGTGSELEEMASRDFFLGGRYGNQVAQQLAVPTNPYAKMCGAIVKEAMREDNSVST